MIDTMMEAIHRNRAIPRPEYPRPHLVREKWMNLNGHWQFEMDPGQSGRERGLPEAKKLQGSILVPFCPESRLSGIGYTDFIPSVWYRRTFTLPEEWAGDRVILHFGAVDYEAVVWVNGVEVGGHRGGYTPFSMDITHALRSGENVVTVWAKDDTRSGAQRSGKQSMRYESYGCYYTRTTGIWQTVWLEAVPALHIASVKLDPDVAACAVHVQVTLSQPAEAEVEVEAFYEGSPVGRATLPANGNIARGTVAFSECHLWEPGHGRLYDLVMTLRRGDEVDTVVTYTGLRSISWGDGVIRINGKPVFQRLILDQGFYPDGIYTAPDDDALKGDIERSMAMGYNGARLHQKVFEPRFLYWADKLGYMVWDEHANWGLDIDRMDNIRHSLREWTEVIERDYNHPSVVGWCPYNETIYGNSAGVVRGEPMQYQDNDVLRITYEVTKLMDPTRPVIDTSGYVHVVTDIYDSHNYEQDVDKFIEQMKGIAEGRPFRNDPHLEPPGAWCGQPYFVSEFGGIRWAPEDDAGWGYGQAPKTEEEFIERYRGLVTWLLRNPKICAFCYTQLTDVEQEVNGLYTYDRKPKFDPAVIAAITAQKAAIEE